MDAWIKKIGYWSFICALGTLFFRRGIFHPFIVQPFEIFTIVSFFCATYSVLKGGVNASGIKQHTPAVMLFFGLFIGALIIGYVSARFFYHVPLLTQEVLGDMFSIGTISLAGLLIEYYAREKNFFTHALNAFLTVLAITPLVYWRSFRLFFHLTDAGLTGFFTNRTAFGNFLIISFAVLVAHFLFEKKAYKKILIWVGSVIVTSFMLWSVSRSSYGVLMFILFCAGIFAIIHAHRKVLASLCVVVLIPLTIISAYGILPFFAKNAVLVRLFPQFSYLQNIPSETVRGLLMRLSDLRTVELVTDTDTINTTIPNDLFLKKIMKDGKFTIQIEDRVTFWKNGSHILARNPLGISTQFAFASRFVVPEEKAVTEGSHNTFLQVGLSAGWLGLVLFLGLCYWAVRTLLYNYQYSWQWCALFITVISLLFTFFFDDRMMQPWVWIPLLLAIQYTRVVYDGNEQNNSIK